MTATPLPRSFYERHSLEVARELVSKILVSTVDGHIVSGRIVEVEAYRGSDDLASHAGRGRTPRNEVMFGEPGHAYVYLSYGVHHMLNAVTESHGTPGAVLIRALEPLDGVAVMRLRRKTTELFSLCSGPGKLTAALGVGLLLDRSDLITGGALAVYDDGHPQGELVCGPRIGISLATALPWRFYLRDCPFVSGAKGPRSSSSQTKDKT